MQSRRDVLAFLGAGTVALAGCGSRSDTPGAGTDPATTSAGTDAPTARVTTREGRPADETDTGDGTRTDTGESGTPSDACEGSWTGEPIHSFEGADGFGRPVVRDDRLFVGTEGGLFALDSDLDPDWRQPGFSGGVYTVAGGAVLGSEGDRVVALDSEDGEVRWTFQPPGDHAVVAWGPAAYDGTVYVGASQVATPSTDPDFEYGRLYGLDLRTGSASFVADLSPADGEPIQPRHVIADAAGVFVTRESGGLLGTDHEGTVRWRRPDDDWSYRPGRAGGLVLQPRSRSLVAVDAANGETRWESDAVEMHVAAADGVAYGSAGGGPDEDGTLAALDAETGDVRWEASIEGCGRRPAVGSRSVAIAVGCRSGPGRVVLHGTGAGCRYGEYEQSADLAPRLAASGDRLYASAGEGRGRLLAFDFP